MLYEGDVIDAVCSHLEQAGYTIKQRLRPNQHGDDIIAIGRNQQEVYIEAKGETSSLETTARYGKPFDDAQCRDHVANAFYKAAVTLQNTPASVTRRVGIALPDTACHRRLAQQIEQVLARLSIDTVWVDSQKHVTVSTPF